MGLRGMNRQGHQGLWRGQAGAAISEFLIAAPILLLLLYAVFDLNDRLDLKQDLRIAARNVAHAGLEGDGGGGLAKDFNNKLLPVHGAVAAVTVPSVNKSRIEASFKESGINDSYENVSSALGTATSSGADVLQGIKNLSMSGQYLLMPDQAKAYTVSVRSTEHTPFQKGMRLLSNLYAKKIDDVVGESAFFYDHVTHVSMRSEAGYHPAAYKYQALPGLFLGQTLAEHRHWGTPAKRENRFPLSGEKVGFMPECMMHFQADSHCKPGNALATTLRVAYVVVGIVKTIASWGSDNASAVAFDEMAKELGQGLSDQVAGYAQSAAEDMAGSEMRKMFDEKIEMEQAFKGAIDQSVSAAGDSIKNNLKAKGVFSK